MFEEYKFVDDEKHFCVIGNDVWIREDVRIMGGVSIHDGAIIASGALVSKDVPPYAVCGGVPAKVIKYRFEKEEIDFLIKNPWWTKNMDWIEQNVSCFRNFEEYKRALEDKAEI